MKTAALAAAVLSLAAPAAPADVIDGASNTIMFGLDAAPATRSLKAPGLPGLRYDVVPRAQDPQPLIGVSLSAAGVVVHSAAGASAVTSSLFFTGSTTVPGAPFSLRDQRDGLVTLPAATRTVAVDPADPSGDALLLSARHVVLPSSNQVRGIHLIQDAAGEAVLVDYDFAGGPPRRTALGYTVPEGPAGGAVVASSDGRAWVALATATEVALFELGDLAGQGPLQPELLGTLPVADSFDPGSTHLGIIAVLIGLQAQPRPSLSIQEGNRLRLWVHDGEAFQLADEQGLPPGVSGLMEEDGLFYYFVSQGSLWRGVVGGGPGSPVNLGH